MTISFEGPTFFVAADEDQFFGWLASLPEFRGIRGVGTTLQLELRAPVSPDSVRCQLHIQGSERMDFKRWYRKAQRKATAMQSQAGALLVAAIVMGGVLKSLAVEAAALAGAIIETFMWTPRLLAVGALLMFAADAWRAWRLHTDPVALYEER